MSWDMDIIQTFLAEIDESEIYANIRCVSGDVLKKIGLSIMQGRGRILYSQKWTKKFFSPLRTSKGRDNYRP